MSKFDGKCSDPHKDYMNNRAAPAPQARPEGRVQCKCGEWFRESAFEAHVITCAETPASGMALPPSCVVGAAPAETAAKCLHCVDGKIFTDSAEPDCVTCDGTGLARETAGEMTAEQFWPTWDVNRDRHGNYSTDYWLALAEAHAKQRVEQAERQLNITQRELTSAHRLWEKDHDRMKAAEAKVADLERERDTARDEAEVLKGELKAAEDGSGITNIQAQYEAQIEALTRRLSGQDSGN